MKFKRLVTSLNASFDDFVTGVENHEAVAISAIADVRNAAARLRAQKGQLDARIAREQTRVQELNARRDRWQLRAADCATQDPEQGLLCLRRRDAAVTLLEQLNAQLGDQRRLAAELANSLEAVELRLAELQNRRTALSSREARANVMAKVATPSLNTNVDELFERWEVAVLQEEYRDGAPGISASSGHDPQDDELDRTLLNAERDEELRAELSKLQNTPHHDQNNAQLSDEKQQ